MDILHSSKNNLLKIALFIIRALPAFCILTLLSGCDPSVFNNNKNSELYNSGRYYYRDHHGRYYYRDLYGRYYYQDMNGQYHYPNNLGKNVDNSDLAAGVRSYLLDDDELNDFDISVHNFNGKIQLDGYVDTKEEKLRAAYIAKHVVGVTSIVNNIAIRKN